MARKPGAPRDRAGSSRRIWAENVTPLVTAARVGAGHAARTAVRERARVRPRPAWWRRRWLLITVAGLGIGMAVAGTLAGLAEREGSAGRSTPAGRGVPNGGRIKSSVEAGRDRVSGAARTMADKVRGGNGADSAPGALASATPDRSKGQMPSTGTGYGQSR